MASPWVQRMVEEQRKQGHAATRRVEPTLADRIPADKVTEARKDVPKR